MAFHAFPSVLPGGFVGVDIFFVISGFLITKIISDQVELGRFSLADFYFRRARRIFPALVVVLFSVSLVAVFVMTPSEIHPFAATVAGSAAFVSNLVLWSQSGYFDAAASTKPLLHLWSLGVEEQFYIIWPLVIMATALWKEARRYVFLLLFAASLAACLVMTHSDPVAAFYSPFSRAWELAAGGIVYNASMRTEYLATRYPIAVESVFALGCLLLLYALAATSEAKPFPGVQALYPVIGAAVVVAVGRRSRIAGLVLGNSLATWIGRISYPLYLWHWPLLVIGRQQGYVSVNATVLLLAATVVLAVATYRLVERPVQRRDTSLRQFASLAIPLTALAIFGYVSISVDPRAWIYPPDIRAAAQYATYKTGSGARVGACWVVSEAMDFAPECYFKRADEKPRVAVWGDSHAARLYPGLLQALSDDVEIAQFTKDGCNPSDQRETPCGATNRLVVDYLTKTPVTTVIIFANWSVYYSFPTFQADLERTLSRLRFSGKQVVVIGPFPNYWAPLPDIIVKDWLAGRISGVPERIQGIPVEATTKAERLVSMVSAAQKLRFVSLVAQLCDERGCLSSVPSGENQLITWDYGHMTLAGATLVAKNIYPLLGVPGRQ